MDSLCPMFKRSENQGVPSSENRYILLYPGLEGRVKVLERTVLVLASIVMENVL